MPAKYVAAGITIAAAGLRVLSLRAFPIFGDEAIYLRLARIVRAAPREHLWVSLQIPNAPLHVWLLALMLPSSNDPVVTGRLLSATLGALLVAAVWGAVHLLGRAFGGRGEEPFLAAAFAALSPFLVFSDRIARPDTLFALEAVLAATLSLAMARRPRPLAAGVAFGMLMGATMLTRQAVSYPLWLLPGIAWACLGRRDWRRFAVPLTAAAAIALAMWLPMLTATSWPGLSDRIFHLGATRPALPVEERAALLARNFGVAIAAFWKYLTPPLFLAALAGLVYLASKRRRLFLFIAVWEALLLLPPLFFAADYFPRYALPAVPPLLAAVGIALAFGWRGARPLSRVAIAMAVLLWPAIAVARGLGDWRRWPLLTVDRQQFVSGWSAGLASERAAAFLEGRGRQCPIEVVLPRVSGNPSDAVWLTLDGVKGVRLFYADDFLRKPALEVRGDVWIDAPGAELASDRPVYLVSQDPAFFGREGWAPADRVVGPLNPGARLVARFENPANESGRVESAVAVYRLR